VGKRLLVRPRRRGDDNIKIYQKEIVYEAMDWIHLAQDKDKWGALVNTLTKLRVP
jgi:hypothetical protein